MSGGNKIPVPPPLEGDVFYIRSIELVGEEEDIRIIFPSYNVENSKMNYHYDDNGFLVLKYNFVYRLNSANYSTLESEGAGAWGESIRIVGYL